ncbi:Universal stress protein family domain containing protein [Amanita muscaria]
MTTDPHPQKKRSWSSYLPRPGSRSKESRLSLVSPLPTPKEGEELYVTSPATAPASINLSRTTTIESPTVSAPSTPKRWPILLTPPSSSQNHSQEIDQQAVFNAFDRTNSNPQRRTPFARRSITSMMESLSSLSLSRPSTSQGTTNGSTDEKDRRGRQTRPSSASGSTTPMESARNGFANRPRSISPFFFRRFRTRDNSPTPESVPLQSDGEQSDVSSVHPRSTAFTDESGDEQDGDAETDDDGFSADDFYLDPETASNTEKNARVSPELLSVHDVEEPDPLGEGVNVILPPEPYFPIASTERATRGKKGPKRRKTLKHEPLPFQTSRPVFQRDRCTTTITQGDPDGKLAGRMRRRYLVASDLGEESRYALEWGIGTVLRDGDELLVVHVIENESKVDPLDPNTTDRAVKLRRQQERQGFAYILVRQSTSLLQRTRLHVRIVCQAWHAKNARHMLLDIADYYEPIMLIVGSRGLGQLSGILLGSTSHYLIQKCSVPVMVSRRRLKRPPKRSAHLNKNRVHVSLAEAAIDRVAAKVDTDVKTMLDEVQRDEEERQQERPTGIQPSMRDARSMSEEGDAEGDEGEDAEDEGDDR